MRLDRDAETGRSPSTPGLGVCILFILWVTRSHGGPLSRESLALKMALSCQVANGLKGGRLQAGRAG